MPGCDGDIARVLLRVDDADGLARFGGGSGDALPQRNVIEIDALVVAHAEAMAQQPLRPASTSKMLKAS